MAAKGLQAMAAPVTSTVKGSMVEEENVREAPSQRRASRGGQVKAAEVLDSSDEETVTAGGQWWCAAEYDEGYRLYVSTKKGKRIVEAGATPIDPIDLESRIHTRKGRAIAERCSNEV